jgi:hypothetical protein
MRLTRLLLPVLAFAALAAPSPAAAGTLIGEVGPGQSIILKTRAGVRVQSVRAGSTWTIIVRDHSTEHDFKLTGPGFSRMTTLAFVGTRTWTVTFAAGTWRYVCTAHPDMMRGSLRAS